MPGDARTPRHLIFDSTPEIFATDNGGAFNFPLVVGEEEIVSTDGFDELRFVVSSWHPSGQRIIDLDRAYLELRARLDPEDDHWTKLIEIEPVVPAYGGGESFDGWVVLPVMAPELRLGLYGGGFEPRTRVQIRSSLYLVA